MRRRGRRPGLGSREDLSHLVAGEGVGQPAHLPGQFANRPRRVVLAPAVTHAEVQELAYRVPVQIHSLARHTPGQLVLPLAQIGVGEAGEVAELVDEFPRPAGILPDDLRDSYSAGCTRRGRPPATPVGHSVKAPSAVETSVQVFVGEQPPVLERRGGLQGERVLAGDGFRAGWPGPARPRHHA